MADLTCRELVELVTDYLEDRLPDTTRRSFEAHLTVCPWCVNYLDQLRESIRLTGELREESLSPLLREELVHAFRGWRSA